jgi:hypothetical protein
VDFFFYAVGLVLVVLIEHNPWVIIRSIATGIMACTQHKTQAPIMDTYSLLTFPTKTPALLLTPADSA